MENKKKYENNIIKKIYDKDYFVICESEKPDFIVKRKSDENIYFGVEVTDFYLNQTNARLKNIKGYYDSIFDKQKYLNKDDINKLSLNEITLISPENKEYKVDAIFKNYDSLDYSENLSNLLVNKNKKIRQYNSKCVYHNLIIYDQEYFLMRKKNNVQLLNLNKKLFDSIKNSDFKEIFLISKNEKDLEIYIPLKLLLISYELRLLRHYELVEKQLFQKIKEFNKNIFFYLLLFKKGYKNVLLNNNNRLETHYSRYKIHIGNSKIEIKVNTEEENIKKSNININNVELNKLIDKYTSLEDVGLLLESKIAFSTESEKIKS